MDEQFPLVYAEWKEEIGLPSEPIAKVLVSQGILFLRKLVNATVLQNRIWEHTSHESDENQAYIYVKPFEPHEQTQGMEMERTIFVRHDVSSHYEAEYWADSHEGFSWVQTRSFDQALDTAQILLDHYLHLKGIHYELQYSVLDPARKKVLLFLRRTAFNS